MNFRVKGLEAEQFALLFGRPSAVLTQQLATRQIADDDHYPDRVSLQHVPRGTPLLLVNHVHQSASTPYRASHAIYVAERMQPACNLVNQIPQALDCRLLSIRAFDANHMMVDADIADGAAAQPLIARLLSMSAASYLHVHFARRGCYAARVERA